MAAVAYTAIGCVSSPPPLNLTSLDPSADQRQIADYYRQNALFFRLKAREMAKRIVTYQRLFGGESEWVSGARLLELFYENAANDQDHQTLLLTIASKDADIARTRAKGEGDSIRVRAEGEAEGLRIRALGQAKAQETISKTLTPDYLRYKLYDSQNSKLVLLPDKLNVPILLNPGSDEPRHLSQDALAPSEQKLSGR